MEFLYLDVSTLTETEQFNKHFRRFLESRESHLLFHMRDDLSTGEKAEQVIIHGQLGWKKFGGGWRYLMPGIEAVQISLPASLSGYGFPKISPLHWNCWIQSLLPKKSSGRFGRFCT